MYNTIKADIIIYLKIDQLLSLIHACYYSYGKLSVEMD